MSDLGWPRQGFLTLIGLAHPESANGAPHPVHLAEAEIDPRTGGTVAVTTEAEFDGNDGVTHLKTYYWHMQPDGDHVLQTLFDIELEQGETTMFAPDGRPVNKPSLVPRKVWVLGNLVYDADDDGDLAHEHGPTLALMGNLSRVMMAAGEVNRDLRDGKLPNVAEILERCHVHEAIGHRLTIVGQSPEAGLEFDALVAREHEANGVIAVPDAVALALTGYGVNTLDEDQRLPPEMSMQATDPLSGTVFSTHARVSEGDAPTVATSIAPTSLFEATPKNSIPCLTNVGWKRDGEGMSTLSGLTLLSDDLSGEERLIRMRALGVTNRILHDLRNRRYPRAMNHLVEYDLQDMVYQFELPPPLSEGGRLTMISVGGNNMRKIADGFGDVIGGNSKVVYHEGLDEKGRISRVGVIVDLGLHLSPKDEKDISAAPDVVEHLRHCNDILITHRHLDHTDGLFVYMQQKLLRGKTIYATPEVIRSILGKLGGYPGIDRDDLPTFVPLKGEGWIHIKDKQGKTRLSVDYARNATPHSARCTPFCIHAHYNGKWIGSYLNHGDARYGKHNGDDYDGPPVEADHLNKDFFTNSNRRLLKEVPGLDPRIADRGPTYFDMDITSIKRKGWGATEWEVENHLTDLSYWFKDKGILLGMISTNDNRLETAFRVATRAHRDLTVVGTNLIKSATTANVLGVNDLVQEPIDRQNIQHYLDMCFEKRLLGKIEAQKQELESADDGSAKEKLQCKLERNEARLEAFKTLRKTLSSFHRYRARYEMEQQLKQRFSRHTTLGSIEEEMPDSPEESGLGSVHTGRTSETSRHIMGMDESNPLNGPEGRRFVLLTGTQNTNAEIDAALVALAEGRHPTLDGNPVNNPLARPVIPENNVVVISQTAIPGNEKKQDDLVRKLVGRNFTVVQAIHDGFKIYNLDDAHRETIMRELAKSGKESQEESGVLTVTGMPIHAGGHGLEKDCEAWAKLVKADVTAAQHTSDPHGGKELAEICANSGLRHMNRIVPNFEGISIRAGETPESTEIASVGKALASLIRIQSVRQQRKDWGGHLIPTRVINLENIGFLFNGLLATANTFLKEFSTIDAETTARQSEARNPGRPVPVPENRMRPPDERPHRGAELPGAEDHECLFGTRRSQSTAFRAGR